MTIPTPRFDSWRADASRRLAPRGQKAELARFLAAHYGREERSWQRYISAFLSGELLPNAEIVLAVDAWFATQDSDGQSGATRRRRERRPA